MRFAHRLPGDPCRPIDHERLIARRGKRDKDLQCPSCGVFVVQEARAADEQEEREARKADEFFETVSELRRRKIIAPPELTIQHVPPKLTEMIDGIMIVDVDDD